MAKVELSTADNLPAVTELAGSESSYYDGTHLNIDDVTQEVLDAALSTYNSDPETYLLGPAREVKKEELSFAAHAYISEMYPSFRRELFIALAEEARNSGLTNRAAYINQVLVWIKTIVAAVITAEDMVDAYGTIEEINSTSLNVEVFAATDPEITVRGAMVIED